MEDNIVKNTEEVEGVRSHVGFTVFRHRGHKLIVGNGLYGMHENGSAELVYEDEDSAPWTVAYVNQWGYIGTTDYKFLMLPIGSETKQTEHEKLLRKLDDLGYTEDEVRRILGV